MQKSKESHGPETGENGETEFEGFGGTPLRIP